MKYVQRKQQRHQNDLIDIGCTLPHGECLLLTIVEAKSGQIWKKKDIGHTEFCLLLIVIAQGLL